GVREYWMIDPQKKLVIQYDLEHIEFPTLYGFEDQVPVLVWEGKCKVNFKEMMENMQFLFEVQG
ncbi:MAG: Uma2 family endonuclease, partial [Oscillospiraceae bacterium]|nr:Uma2 family endonuclease [Oscillospiraceae bacterium]